ncbi:DUF2809 domain-containing protein [Pedobacter sp. SYSU D00535]|uniref:ribosomal maturation YjgA family protein n=1 Tax=Pedobacter sp. SYSU D00535 TaxID=2810308 RepID=UPI001A962CEB|nr:DUF2809 domain-containing protein [Pedobacter sp. SYSU D00535]
MIEHLGDALWAAMVYFGFRFLEPAKPPIVAFFFALTFSFFIEASQLYQANWLNKLRETTIGALVLGRGFLAIDLLRYSVGILTASRFDYLLISKNQKRR